MIRDAKSKRDSPLELPDGLAQGSFYRVESVAEPVDHGEVFRYLGYSTSAEPSARLTDLLNATINEAAALAEPRAVFAIFPVLSAGKKHLRLATAAGETEFHGAIGEFLGPVQWAAAFIASAGSKVESRSRELIAEGDYLSGLVYDAVGSERAEAVETVVLSRLREQLAKVDLGLTLPYSPGYCGMALTEQIKLFGLFDGQTLGVTLSAHCLMQPVKSISGLAGIGPAAAIKQQGSPCDRCELWTCNMRR
jgi:cobalamin-dependent methionine synthase I